MVIISNPNNVRQLTGYVHGRDVFSSFSLLFICLGKSYIIVNYFPVVSVCLSHISSKKSKSEIADQKFYQGSIFILPDQSPPGCPVIYDDLGANVLSWSPNKVMYSLAITQ